MGRKEIYTKEQIHTMKMNPYTHSVNAYQITFTLEFKEFFVDQIRNHRKNAPQILKAAGYDPLGLPKDAKAVCVDVFLKKQILSEDFVPRVVFQQRNRLLHLKAKIFLSKKQKPASRNYKSESFIWKSKLSF